MSENLSIQGTLAETTVPDLFRSLVRTGESAIVSLDAIGRGDIVYFSDGRIIFASSTDPDMGLGEVLLRGGELNLHQYNHAMEKLVVSRRIGALLCELGYLQPDELLRGIEKQAHAIVLNVMSVRSGSYTVEFTNDFPDEIITLPLNTERLILDGVKRIDYWSLITRGLGRFERLLEQVPGAEMRLLNLELDEEESHILSLLSEPTPIETVCERTYLPNFNTCRTLWGLLSVNVIQDAESSSMEEKRTAEQTEYEMEALVERYNSMFQTIWAMVFQKIDDHIYDFVDRVVLHLSPETLPYLSGMNMVNEGRVDIDQLLNNLIASGSEDQSAVVANVLNELLYGWVFEIKSEFGAEMESEVVRMAEALRR